MSEQCEWKVRYSDTKRWDTCEKQTAFDDRFCPIHMEIAIANDISAKSESEKFFAQIAESLKILALCAEITIRWEQDEQARKMPLEAFSRMVKQHTASKEGD